MSDQFIVARGCSIVLGSGKVLRAGHIITEGKPVVVDGKQHEPMPKRKIVRHILSGYLKPISAMKDEGPISPDQFTENAPGKTTPQPLPGPGKTGLPIEKALKTSTPGGIETASLGKIASPETVKTVTSKWTLDPELLKGKTIDELNVMVAERDATLSGFATAEEAVAWLSQDHDQVKAVAESVSVKGGKKENKDSQVATG